MAFFSCVASHTEGMEIFKGGWRAVILENWVRRDWEGRYIRVINASCHNQKKKEKSQWFNIVKIYISFSHFHDLIQVGELSLDPLQSVTQESRHLPSCNSAILNTWPMKLPWKGKIERMITPEVLWAGLEVMYITSAHMSEPSHMDSTRLPGPLEYVVVLCA